MEYTKGLKNKESKKDKRNKKKKAPAKTQPQQKTQSTPTKIQYPFITLHHNNPLAFALCRTKTLSIIISIALTVMKFSIPFNLRSGDWDLKTLPLNHLSHDVQKIFYVPLKRNPHSLKVQHNVEQCPREPTTSSERPSLEDSPTSTGGEE
jgi:hypothetical protein